MNEQPLFSPKINFPFGRGGSGLYFSGKQDCECVPVTVGIQTPEKKITSGPKEAYNPQRRQARP